MHLQKQKIKMSFVCTLNQYDGATKGDFEKGDNFGSLDTLKLVEGVLEIFST